jgi:hypothetical protein
MSITSCCLKPPVCGKCDFLSFNKLEACGSGEMKGTRDTRAPARALVVAGNSQKNFFGAAPQTPIVKLSNESNRCVNQSVNPVECDLNEILSPNSLICFSNTFCHNAS